MHGALIAALEAKDGEVLRPVLEKVCILLTAIDVGLRVLQSALGLIPTALALLLLSTILV